MTMMLKKVKKMFEKIVDKCCKKQPTILVLGFYDRGNMGDEQYKVTIPLCFPRDVRFDFVSVDDANKLDHNSSYDCILCGGGDIINPYFMEKVKIIIGDYKGRVYALSVGIPFDVDVRYLDIFDHVFVRNSKDALLAQTKLGKENVTLIPDLGFFFPSTLRLRSIPRHNVINIGMCLATPVYKRYEHLRKALPLYIRGLLHMTSNSNVVIHFFHFNYNDDNDEERDIVTSNDVMNSLSFLERRCCILHKILTPNHMIESLGKMSFNVCMRYHSIIFSSIAKTPFVALFANKKVATLLEDLDYPSHLIFDIKKNVDWSQWLEASQQPQNIMRNFDFPIQVAQIINSRRQRSLLVTDERTEFQTFDEAVISAKSMLDAYFGYTFVTTETLQQQKRFNVGSKDPMQIARIICYAITGNLDDPCAWGLSENMRQDNFILYEALQFIHSKHIIACKENLARPQLYYPSCKLEQRVFVTIDPFTNVHLAKDVHRSGWANVMSHLMNLSAPRFHRPHRLIVDTYMDRTFHWGQDTMVLNGLLPYRTSWIGFLHHTFDTVHSSYNCLEMFKNEVFRESLATCKGIIVLTRYLARQVKAALKEYQLPNVDVHVIYHPTEFVTRNAMFTYEKFIANPSRKVVQIGAWLRNPYAIYKLPLYDDLLNPLGITKAVLKGKQMDGYFASEETLKALLAAAMEVSQNDSHYTYDCISRECISKTTNKYMVGLVETIQENHDSVHILHELDNASYDDLLSKNIVFLQLQDCSAVNTVIECMVRNTVIIVNRHPAIEELLGAAYPGFYDSLVGASLILGNPKVIKACYKHIKNLAKTDLRIETFMKRFVDIVSQVVSNT